MPLFENIFCGIPEMGNADWDGSAGVLKSLMRHGKIPSAAEQDAEK
jgi:hypothetical protein